MISSEKSATFREHAWAYAHATAAAAGAQLASMGLAFNAFAFVASVRGRGMSIAADAFGKITCSPASVLNQVDRETLASPEKRRHRRRAQGRRGVRTMTVLKPAGAAPAFADEQRRDVRQGLRQAPA